MTHTMQSFNFRYSNNYTYVVNYFYIPSETGGYETQLATTLNPKMVMNENTHALD